MLKKLYHEKYFSIAAYACAVTAALIALLAVWFYSDRLGAALSDFASVMQPVFFAMVIAYFCNPVMKKIEKYVFGFLDRFPRFPRLLRRIFSLILTYLLVLSILAGMLMLAIPEIVQNYESLIRNITAFILKAVEKANELLQSMNMEDLSTLISGKSDELLRIVGDFIAATGLKVVKASFWVTLTVVLSFFMLLYKEHWTSGTKRFLSAVLPKKWYYEAQETLRFAGNTFGRYLLGTVFDSILVGLEVFLVISILGYPYRAVISILIGITNMIPYFGPFLGAIPSVIILLTHDAGMALWFVVIILAIQQIDGNLIMPRIVGETVGISSMWVIIAVTVIGGWLGVLGMFIAIPLFSVVYMLLSRIVNGRLRKRGLPVDADIYSSSFSISKYLREQREEKQQNEEKGGENREGLSAK